jgi:acetolactate synthase-1/3 small subunit
VRPFRAAVVDVSPDAVTVEAAGSPDELGTMLRVLEPFGIRELVRSGTIAIGRASRSVRTFRSGQPLAARATTPIRYPATA